MQTFAKWAGILGIVIAPSCNAGHPPPPAPPVDVEVLDKPVVPGASVGYLPGGPEAMPTGELTYRVPLDVPPSVVGMEPTLALSYSSRGANGILGRGWSLAGGFSSIAR